MTVQVEIVCRGNTVVPRFQVMVQKIHSSTIPDPKLLKLVK
jgi:hypothetical protein